VASSGVRIKIALAVRRRRGRRGGVHARRFRHAGDGPPAPAVTGVPDTGPITLTVWDQESGQVSKVWDQLNAEFEQKYPTSRSSGSTATSASSRRCSGSRCPVRNGPDVVEANQGWPDMGHLVKAGLAPAARQLRQAYGWTGRVSPNVLRVSSWSPDGKEFGTGNLYGYTTMGEIVGVYYNKQILSDLGLTVPTTFSEFEQDLETAKQAGQIPIQFANNDAFPGIHEFATIQDQMAPTSYLTDLIFGTQRDQLSFDTPENTQAATTLQDWANKGYFTPGFGGAGYDDAVSNFAKGQGLFMITGNWIVANLGADNKSSGSSRCRRRTRATRRSRPAAPASRSRSRRVSEHPDAAAAYIDWMTSDHASDLLLPTGEIPLHNGKTPTVQPGTVLADVVDAARP
jgi:raffinose/stachyose/melibiose transport system substrate-binding protein